MTVQTDFLERCKALNLHDGKLSDWLDEIESLRQQLAAALAACKLKDAAIKDLLEFATYSTCGKAHAVEAAKEALTIQPDDQLAAAYEAGKRDAIPEWQPMETAPKNGTAFRAYADELIDLDFNPWGSVEAAWNGEEFIGCVWNGQQDSWYGKAITPSHWIPLPAAPKGLK